MNFRQRLLACEKLLGTMQTLNSPAISEMLAEIGFDWIFVDAEHAVFELSDVQAILQAVGNEISCLVRIPQLGEAYIKQFLDLGASGIIIPQVNSAEQARSVVQFSRYSPLGSRGVGLGRAHRYGLKFQEYVESANDEVVVVVQAEHIDAVNNIESIVQVTGIDCVLVGPYDLSASMNKTGQVDHPEVIDAINHITTVCRDAKMPLGIFGVNADSICHYAQQGFTLLVAGTDTILLSQSAKKLLSIMREF